MRITTDDGVELVASVVGSGPDLLLVHGFGGVKEDFSDHVDALAERHRVIVFDHRGHGESDAPDDERAYSLDRLATDVLCVADACGADRFTLLGHSMGGMVARRVVLSTPERIRALILMDTSHGPVTAIDPALAEAAAVIALAEGKDVLKQLLDAAATLDTPAYQRLLRDRPGYVEFQDYKWASLSAVMWAALAREVTRQPDELTRLRAVECPTLVIVGEQDAPFLEDSKRMAAAIAGAELAVVADSGHSPQFENPDAWLHAMRAFLASTEPVAVDVDVRQSWADSKP